MIALPGSSVLPVSGRPAVPFFAKVKMDSITGAAPDLARPVVRPTVEAPLNVRGRELGGPRPFFCIPLVSSRDAELVAQAEIARGLNPDLVEWRADYSHDCSPAGLLSLAAALREALPDHPILFTLRKKAEGGAQEIAQPDRQSAIEAVLRSGAIDLLDLELHNEPEFLQSLIAVAREQRVPVILAFHDFQTTPPTETLHATIAAMCQAGADVAKLAVMPQTPEDVLRLLQLTSEARKQYPGLPLAIMGMGSLGSITRVAGFLYGSDMAFAVGKLASAPGQIPIAEARLVAETLLRYS
jgi:3-dehydroquinate dehydratase-1